MLDLGVRAVLHLVLQSRQTQPLVDTIRLRPWLMVLKFLIHFCRYIISPIEFAEKGTGSHKFMHIFARGEPGLDGLLAEQRIQITDWDLVSTIILQV